MNRSPHGRTARRAVVFGSIVFIAAQVMLNAAVRANLVPLADPIFIEKFERLSQHSAYFESTPAQTRYLLLGSSRSQLGFDAKRFSERITQPACAFNFGTHGAGPITNLLYARRLADAGVRAEHVLIEIHPCLLHEHPLELAWLSGYRLRPGEAEILQAIECDIETPRHLGVEGWFSSSFAYRLPALNRYATRWLPCPFGLTIGAKLDSHGYAAGLELSEIERRIAFQRTIGPYANVFPQFRAGGVPFTALARLVTEYQHQNCVVSLLMSAEDSQFRALYPRGSHTQLVSLLQTLNVPLIDAREWVPDDGFADGHHLNPRGAAIFTDRICDTLLQTNRGGR